MGGMASRLLAGGAQEKKAEMKETTGRGMASRLLGDSVSDIAQPANAKEMAYINEAKEPQSGTRKLQEAAARAVSAETLRDAGTRGAAAAALALPTPSVEQARTQLSQAEAEEKRLREAIQNNNLNGAWSGSAAEARAQRQQADADLKAAVEALRGSRRLYRELAGAEQSERASAAAQAEYERLTRLDTAQAEKALEAERRQSAQTFDIDKMTRAAVTPGGLTGYLEATRGENNAVQGKINALEADIEGAKRIKTAQNYMTNTLAPDFARNSRYRKGSIDDADYAYINRDPEAIKAKEAQMFAGNGIVLDIPNQYVEQMSDDQIAMFNYLYHTKGKNTAYEYIKFLEPDLNAAQRQQETRQWQAEADAHPAGASAVSVIMAPMKGASYLGQAVDYLADGKIDQNAAYNRYSYASSGIRQRVSELAEDKWGKKGSFLYQTGMSMGDFLMTTLVSGGFSNPGSQAAQKLALSIMGTGAAADSTIAAKDRGLSDDQAFAIGTIAGAAEVITEKVSLDNLLDMTKLGKNKLGYFLQNVLAEGSEEVGSDFINLFADILVAKDKSEWQQSIDQYKAQGMDEKTAFWHAAADQAENIGLDFLGGALSGGIMSGGGIVLNQAAGNHASVFDGVHATESTGQEVPGGVRYSIKNTRTMPWQAQIEGYFSNDGSIKSSDSLYLGDSHIKGVRDAPRYIPTSVVSKAIRPPKGSRSAHALTQADIMKLESGIENAPIVIHNPARNALVYVTENQDASGGYIIASFDLNNDLHGETAHKATSIHGRENIVPLLEKLGADATVFVKNENKLNQMLPGNQILKSLELLAKVEFESGEPTDTVSNTDITAGPAPYAQSVPPSGSPLNSIPQSTQKSKGIISDKQRVAFGTQGQQVVETVLEQSMNRGLARWEAYAGFSKAYQWGLTGGKMGTVPGMSKQAVQIAYEAGRADAPVYEKADSGVVSGGNLVSAKLRESVDKLAKRLGTRVMFRTDMDSGINGEFDPDTGIISLNANKGEAELRQYVTGHEFVHRVQQLAPEAYNAFRSIAAQERGHLVQATLELYKEKGKALTYEQALDEVTADYGGELMDGGETLDRFITEHKDERTLLEKLRDAIRAILDTLTGREKSNAELAMKKLQSAIDAAAAEVEQRRTDGRTTTAEQKETATAGGNVRYSISYDRENTPFVVVESDILAGIPESDWVRTVKENLRKKFPDGVTVGSNKIKIDKTSQREMTWSGYSQWLMRNSPEVYADKLRATDNSDEILLATTDYINEGLKHPRKDNIKYFARGTVQLRIGENDYTAEVIVGTKNDGSMLLYDLLNLKETKIKERSQTRQTANPSPSTGRSTLLDSSNNSISDSGEKINNNFSLAGVKEAAKTLTERYEEIDRLDITEEEREILRQEAVQDALAGAMDQYGEIPAGEHPAREVHIPKKTSERERVSQTVRTVLEAKATPDELLPDIERLVAEEQFSYESYGDEQAIRDAEEVIRDKSTATAYADWRDDIRKGVVSKEHTALGWTLYNNAANSGDTKMALDILQNMVDHQRSAAQALQATRILKTLSPETRLYNVQRSVRNLQEELKKRYKDKAPTLKLDEELAADFLQAETEEAREAAEAALYRDIGRQMPSTFIDKWNAWRYLSMLGNARTHARNLAGNAGFMPVVAAKNALATGLETAVDKVSGGKAFSGERGERTKSLTAGTALYRAAFADYQQVVEQIMEGGKYQDFAQKKAIEDGRVIFKTKPLEWARRQNGALLELEDSWFAKPHYAAALASYCKANGITAEQVQSGKGLDKAREYAIREAQKATYRDTNDFSQWVSSIGRYSGDNKAGRAASKLLEGILPFRKTPANILARGVEYSPIGLLERITRGTYRVEKGRITTAEWLDGISAGLTGTGLLGLGFWLAGMGLARGGGSGDDDKKRKFDELTGHQEYSLELPDGTSVTLDWLAPEALPFFVGVNLYEELSAKNGGERLNMADWMKALGNVSEPMLEMSCLQSLNDLFDSVSYGKKEGSALGSAVFGSITSYLMQGLPTLFGQAERAQEGKRMTTYTEDSNWMTKDLQYTLGKASARIPGLDFLQIPYIDAWGREELTGKPASRVANNFLNPAYTSKIDESGMEQELLRLYEQTKDDGVFPQRAGKFITVDKVEKKLTGEEYVKYATVQGQTAYSLVCKLVDSKAYRAMDDETKAACIEDAYDYAEAYAKTQVSDYAPTGWQKKAFNTVRLTGMSPADYICAYQAQKGIVSLRDADGETIANSEGLLKMEAVYSVPGLTDAQRKRLFQDFGVGKSVQGYNRAAVEEKLGRMR